MKKKPLVYYLDLMKSALNKQDGHTAKRLGEIVLKKLHNLSYLPSEEYSLYSELGRTYLNIGEFSRSLDSYYKSYLIADKNNIGPSCLSLAIYGMGRSFLSLRNIEQGLQQFHKVEEYYKKYGADTFPMDKQRHFFTFLSEGYCYLYKNNLIPLRDIIEQKLIVYQSLLPENTFVQYYHLKGEYLMAIKEYEQARQSFMECIKIHEKFGDNFAILSVKIHLAVIELLGTEINESIKILQGIMKDALRLKFYSRFCEAGLILIKCHHLNKLPDKAAAIEKKVKPTLNKLDITWLYEKTRELEQLYHRLQHIYQDAHLDSKHIPVILSNALNQHYEKLPYKIIGQSQQMREICQVVVKGAPTDLPILIQGETGTGKELVARSIHQNSLRQNKFWLAINCGAVPESLLEGELFGYNKGAFTDAYKDRRGYIELASDGTLFLDEISEMSMAMQQKLLRVLDEKLVWRLGSEKPIPVNTRFIFASNQNVEELVKKRLFRQDLFHRINTIVINLPPLRDRKDDIPLLINHFLDKYALHKTPDAEFITPDALRFLTAYPWPGNIRELENEIKRICVLYQDVKIIKEEMISDPIRNYATATSQDSNRKTSLRGLKDAYERNLIIKTLKKYNGNITQSARELECLQPHLSRKIKQLEISPVDYITKK